MKQIFLPIEIKVREFHGKLLFALFAAEQGFEVTLGGQLQLIERLPRLGRGIYIDKSTSILKAEWFRTCRALGHQVAAWDEEGLLYLSDEVYHVTRMHEEAFRLTDLFFAWGPHHARTVLARYPEAADRVVPVGNPRMDLLRPEFRGYCDDGVAVLRRKYGRILLINTNFPLHNFIRGPKAAAEIFGSYPLKNKHDLLQGWGEFQRQGYEGFMEAAAAMHERFPEHTIVIRPAPVEDIGPWQRRSAGRPRIVVSKDGNVVEWIRAADAVVQFNCTTGVEAFLLDVPSIAYRCVRSNVYETPLSIACSTEAFTLDELLAQLSRAVDAATAGQPPLHPTGNGRTIIDDHLTAISGPTACERILATIRRRDFVERPYTLPSVPLIKRVWRACLRVVRRPNPMDMRVALLKFPGLSVEEAMSVAAAFSRTTGRFRGVRIERVGANILRIRPA